MIKVYSILPNKYQVFASYQHLVKHNYCKSMETKPTSYGEYFLSDLEYSTRKILLKTLKNDSYIDIVDMKHRMN